MSDDQREQLTGAQDESWSLETTGPAAIGLIEQLARNLIAEDDNPQDARPLWRKLPNTPNQELTDKDNHPVHFSSQTVGTSYGSSVHVTINRPLYEGETVIGGERIEITANEDHKDSGTVMGTISVAIMDADGNLQMDKSVQNNQAALTRATAAISSLFD
jgi:hypothetical protein